MQPDPPPAPFAPPAGNAARMRRALGDLVLIGLFVCVAVLFLSANGSVGNSEIQPYPY